MINELKEKIENNLFKLDAMTDLLEVYEEGEQLDNLYKTIYKLSEETKELQSKVNQLVNHAS